MEDLDKVLAPMLALKAYREFFASDLRYCALMGGAGSGKSYAACQKVLARLLTQPGLRVLVLRKVAATLRQSVWQLMLEQIAALGMEARFSPRPGMMVIAADNGAEAIFRGCDDAEKIKSIQGIGAVWMEEATEFEEHDLQLVASRLRGATPGYKQIILTLNPTQARHWICRRFWPEDYPDAAETRPVPRNVLKLRTTAAANPEVGADYAENMALDMAPGTAAHRVYVLGKWGTLHTGGEFYKYFSEARHCGPAPYSPTAPLHISFDFNVQPYMTATIWQTPADDVAEAHGLPTGAPAAWQVGELCLAPPANTVEALCEAILAGYGNHLAPVHIYGDPSGNNRQQSTGQGHYAQILRALAPLSPQNRVASAAPKVAQRREWFAYLFNPNTAPIVEAGSHNAFVALRIAPACTHTIADYLYLQEDAEGAKSKAVVKDPATGRSYQRYGHCSDANDYLLCRLFERQFRAFSSKGKALPMGVFGER